MAKSRKLETLLAKLNQLRQNFSPGDPVSDDAIATLRQGLNSRYGVAAGQAAKQIAALELVQLAPDMVKAFYRFMARPIETDPNCLGKAGIAKALYQLGCSEQGLFLDGIRHVQMEPVWGGKQDTAPKLRGLCALGLVRMNDPDVMTELADLLADADPAARIAAAQAIAYSENDRGVPLLRLRAKVGDEPQVLSECLAALLKLAPNRSLDFVSRFLSAPHPTSTQELVALVLGESRLPEAFEQLHTWWQKTVDRQLRRTGLLAIAMLRSDQPLQFLLSVVESGHKRDAFDAIASLSIYRQDIALWQRLRETVEQRDDDELRVTLERDYS